MKVYLIAGHSLLDSGAIIEREDLFKVIKESQLAIQLRDLIKVYLETYNNVKVITDDDNLNLREVISEINKSITKNDILIDIHFNAFNKQARGTEAFIPTVNSELEKELAEKIVAVTSKIISTPNRGVRTEKQSNRGRLGILHGVGHRILWEVCFMDSKTDLDNYISNIYILANDIAEQIEKYI
jgi:N-acetylmuramoyl-L-alanine amidase